MRLPGKLMLTTVLGAAVVFGTAAASLGAGTVTLGKPVIKRNGTAVLPATFSGPGTAVLWDASTLHPCGGPPRIKRVDVTVQQPGTLRLPVRPESSIKPNLKQGRKVKVPVEVQFQPQGQGTPEVFAIKRIVLRIKSAATTSTAAAPRCTPPAP